MKIGLYLSAHKTEVFSQKCESNEKTIIRELDLDEAQTELGKLKSDILNNWIPNSDECESVWGKKIITINLLIDGVDAHIQTQKQLRNAKHFYSTEYKYTAFFMESRMIAIAEWYANYNSYRYDTRGITIENMFSHPGVKGAGSILMEYMVNKSEHAGELGIICVDALEDELRIYSNEKLVASHRLCSASSGWQTVPEHHAPLWQQVSQVEHRPLSESPRII
ncbi:IS21 family transposase [Escherichia coli]|uniref:hypothetical protein n=1 Tax=Escherichia coli TaxID=562 RepID=UPI0006A42F38|nr:hypothetical protein [Escherichia coli]EFJ5640465.1 hypothetical protein [Escherichia coli]CTY39289.1 IS21 family transposase [Escherichia coli]